MYMRLCVCVLNQLLSNRLRKSIDVNLMEQYRQYIMLGSFML